MKKYFLFLAVSGFLASCRTPVQDISFFIPTTSEYSIPSSTVINLPFAVSTPEVETKSQSSFSGNNTRGDLIKEISLSSISLEVLEPVGEDFSFLEAISVFIVAEDLPEVEIASLDAVDANQSLIFLETTGADLQAYLKKDKYVMRTSTTTKEFLTEDYRLEIKSRFLVKAQLIDND
jgi:hypothetical protein